MGMNLSRERYQLRHRQGPGERATLAAICHQEGLPLCFRGRTLGSQIVSLDNEKKVPRPWPTTCYHEELLQVLDDINLEDRSDSWDVGEGVFQDIQCVQPFLSAHQHHLQEQKSTGGA